MSATTESNQRWLAKWLAGEPHQVIGDGSPYLLRWYVLPRNRILNVYLHKFLRSDDDRALHDHPWWFVSLILQGGYVEISESSERKMTALCRTSILDIRSPFWRRAIAYRTATYRHRVALPIENGVEQPCWTLVVTGPRTRTWGFWCPRTLLTIRGRHIDSERFVPWQQWDAAGCGETS